MNKIHDILSNVLGETNPVKAAREIGRALIILRQAINTSHELDDIYRDAAKRGPYTKDDE